MANLINKIIEQANIVDVISKYVQLTKKGANYFGLCPFHPDTNPSMSVSSKKKIFKCFSCGVGGNVITFVQKFKKISFGQAVKELSIDLGYSMQEINDYFSFGKSSQINFHLYSLNNNANDLFKLLLFNEANKKYLNYLYSRKLSNKIIEQFNLGFCGKDNEKTIVHDLLINQKKENFNDDDLIKTSLISINEKTGKLIDYFFNRITFPLKDINGFIVGFIGRDIENNSPKYLISKETTLFSKSNVLYNFDQIVTNNPSTLIVVEGNIDLLSLYEIGIDENKYGVIALMGLALTTNHLKLIKDVKSIKNIILWFDNDEPGKKTTLINGIKFLQQDYNVYIVNNSTKYKDINEILINHGKQEVLNLLFSENNDDFITYYIKVIFTKFNQVDLTNLVIDCLNLIAKYGKSLYWTKYMELIVSITKLNFNDLTTTYQKIAKKKYSPKQDFQFEKLLKKEQKIKKYNKNYLIILSSLKESLTNLIYCLVLSPNLAMNIYEQLKHKKINISLFDNVMIFIKALCENFESVNKTIINLYTSKKISADFYEQISNLINNARILKEKNMLKPYTKKKINSLIDNIDECCFKLQYEDNLNKINQKVNNKKQLLENNKKLSYFINLKKRHTSK